MRTRIKICGITNTEDALQAVDAGADALGMVFYKPSPRYVDVGTAVQIAQSTPAFVSCVGLFVNAEADEVKQVLNQVPLQLLQFHGDETPQYCRQFSLPYMKALRVGAEGGLSGDALRTQINSYSDAQAILLDTYQKAVPGGTGERFDWDLVPESRQKIVLAGGLTPDNVAAAIKAVEPYAVDVSSGVESAPGVKDVGRIRAFVDAVYLADHP